MRETDLLEEGPVEPDLPTALRPGGQPAEDAVVDLEPFQVATLRFTR